MAANTLTVRSLIQLLNDLPENQKDLDVLIQPDINSSEGYGYNSYKIRPAYFEDGLQSFSTEDVNCIVVY